VEFENAFLTGASSGIGRNFAKHLARKGTRIIAAARRQDELDSLVDIIRKEGGRADPCLLDVADTHKVYEAMGHWDQEVGGFDLVVANAGVGITAPADELVWKDVEAMLHVNVLGAFATLMAGCEVMKRRGQGTLVGVSSLASMRGLPGSGAYSASKAALATFLETIRTDLHATGIRVVDVRPGFVDTPMTRGSRFKMPFLMDVDRAAELMLSGIVRGDEVVAFPWQTSATMSVAEAMPDVVWRMIAKWIRSLEKGASRD
jgi:short-subunit dehydrogenase